MAVVGCVGCLWRPCTRVCEFWWAVCRQVAPEEHIRVTKEQFDLYCDIDSAFETCKICDARAKSIRLEPCGHLLCQECMAQCACVY